MAPANYQFYQHLAQPPPGIDPLAMHLQPPALAPQPNVGILGMLPIEQPAGPMQLTSQALARLEGFYDNYRRSEPPLDSPAGFDQLGFANLPGNSIVQPPREEPAVNPVPLWGSPPRGLAQDRNHGAGLDDINYNDFVDALDDFNRDDFMDILDGIREEEARGLGRAPGNPWDF